MVIGHIEEYSAITLSIKRYPSLTIGDMYDWFLDSVPYSKFVENVWI